MKQRPSATTLLPELWPEELAALLDLVKDAWRGGTCLEIGTAAGGSLCRMIENFVAERRPRFVVVDPMQYFPNQLEIVKKNLAQHGIDATLVDFRISTSDAAYARAAAARESFDFMLIDGAHKIRYVTQDLRWLGLLRPGGIACFHDYDDPGVKLPADRFLRKHSNYTRERLAGRLLALRKNAAGAAEVSFADRAWAAALSPVLQLQASAAKRRKKQGHSDHG